MPKPRRRSKGFRNEVQTRNLDIQYTIERVPSRKLPIDLASGPVQNFYKTTAAGRQGFERRNLLRTVGDKIWVQNKRIGAGRELFENAGTSKRGGLSNAQKRRLKNAEELKKLGITSFDTLEEFNRKRRGSKNNPK